MKITKKNGFEAEVDWPQSKEFQGLGFEISKMEKKVTQVVDFSGL